MNTIASLPITAASPVAIPAIAVEHPYDDSPAALARAEQIVETLRTKYVADGWTLFEPAAEQMLEFFRRRMEGKPERDNEFKMDVVEFFEAHGQSLDWVICGDPGVMICRLAAAKSQERGEADAELLVLVEEYIAAKQKFERKPPRGDRKAVREMNRADKTWGRLEDIIRDTRATTVEGMIAKMRCARAYEGWEHENVQDRPPHTMALSIMRDLEELAKTA